MKITYLKFLYQTKPKRTDRKSEAYLDLPLFDQSDDDNFYMERSSLDVHHHFVYKIENDRCPPKKFIGSRMWRAMELAISICEPSMSVC